jgi:hypothetical protein
MPSVIHQSPKMSARGLSLVAQNVSEQINGLVEVGLQFVTTASARDRVAREFVVDSPPPIWPSSVNREELQGRQLFMAERSITQEAGLVYISAKYVGGLLRAGAPGYFLSTTRESKQTTYNYELFRYILPALTDLSGQGQFTRTAASCFYRWLSIVHSIEFVVVYNNDAPVLPKYKASDLASLESFGGQSPYGLKYISIPQGIGALGEGRRELVATREVNAKDAQRLIGTHRIVTNESPTYVTPTVQIIQRDIFTEPEPILKIAVTGLQAGSRNDSFVALETTR